MGATRKNTLVIDFSVLPVRPDPDEIEKFLDSKVKLDFTVVKNLQLHNIRNCALIEMRSLEVAEELAALHHLKHFMIVKNKKYLIPIHLDDSAINVRINDLPPDMPNAVIAEEMKKYGKVKSIAREMWKKYFRCVPNGVRVVRMELEKQIPSYIVINGERTSTSYRDQIPTCRHCDRRSHPKQKCSEAAAAEKTQQPPKTTSNTEQQKQQEQQQQQQQYQQSNNTADNELAAAYRKRIHSPDTDKNEQNEDSSSEDCEMEMEQSPNVNGEDPSIPEWITYELKKRSRSKKINTPKM